MEKRPTFSGNGKVINDGNMGVDDARFALKLILK